MKLAPEHREDFDALPAALRQLLTAELAAGNSIVEVAHCFPAPPAGAYFKLAQKISTCPRASGGGVVFYERNNSSYSGEFTDAKRFYFILEPPNPPPPYPDMDAIRQAAQGRPDALTQLAQRETGSGLAIGKALVRKSLAAPKRALTATETATGVTRVLHFQDKRPPHEIQFVLERNLMTLFTPTMENGRLSMHTQATVVGGRYFVTLRFEAALLLKNCYSLRVETSWAEHAATHHDYYRKTADSWFSLWTRDFMAANPPRADAGPPERYRKLAEAALQAEAHLDSVAAIQQAIVTELKRGGSFGTSHKEGGTDIFWRNGEFVRSDYGDYPDLKQFKDEAEFLKMLRQFCQWDVTRNAGQAPLSDFDIWKLILRRLRTK